MNADDAHDYVYHRSCLSVASDAAVRQWHLRPTTSTNTHPTLCVHSLTSSHLISFSPCDAMLARYMLLSCVCVSVTRRYYIKTRRAVPLHPHSFLFSALGMPASQVVCSANGFFLYFIFFKKGCHSIGSKSVNSPSFVALAFWNGLEYCNSVDVKRFNRDDLATSWNKSWLTPTSHTVIIVLCTKLDIECDWQTTVVGRLLTTLGNDRRAVAKLFSSEVG